jgi:hypothetical protein
MDGDAHAKQTRAQVNSAATGGKSSTLGDLCAFPGDPEQAVHVAGMNLASMNRFTDTCLFVE